MTEPFRPTPAWAFALTTFLTMVPVTLVVPVLKPLVQDRLGTDAFQTSLFMAVNMLGSVIAAPIAGSVSDRLGRRRGLAAAALVLNGILLASLTRAETYGTLMALRTLQGVADALALSLILGAAADAAESRPRGHLMGLVGAALTLGVAVGAPVGGLIGKSDPTRPLLLGGALCFLAAGSVWFLLRDAPNLRRARSTLAALLLTYRNRALRVPCAFAFVDRLTVGFFVSAFPLYVGNVLKGDAGDTGRLLALFLVPFALLCYPIGRLIRNRQLPWFVAAGSIAYGAAVMLVGEVPASTLPYLMGTLGVLSGVMFVPTLILTSYLAGPRLRASAMGAFQAAGSLGFFLGPILAGAIVQAAGYPAAFWVAGACEIACVAAAWPALRRLHRDLLLCGQGPDGNAHSGKRKSRVTRPS